MAFAYHIAYRADSFNCGQTTLHFVHTFVHFVHETENCLHETEHFVHEIMFLTYNMPHFLGEKGISYMKNVISYTICIISCTKWIFVDMKNIIVCTQ
ncbi:hypothetical protein FHX64_001836 [Microbacter margulisiae]|uniref:Uncharacterized protein n=1 Tax=Microbacter margulisiae TaxID=1350067 RepID=A0A7W5DS13_9PORP|nr:hypothetical protein [Microbacter margulisiae]